MGKLHAEISARLQEMAVIATRAMVEKYPKFGEIAKRGGSRPPTVQFNLKTTHVCYGSGRGMCLCYNYDTSTCSVCDGPMS